MARPYLRVTRNPAALLRSTTGAVRLVVVGFGLGVMALQRVRDGRLHAGAQPAMPLAPDIPAKPQAATPADPQPADP